jgi:DNA-directed RNA polymerase specialized sigma24 family protein
VKKEWTLTEDSFYKLLGWLDADQERAGKKYEEIRQALIKIFSRKGCYCAEELADKTINRVMQKLDDIMEDYVGDPAPYFYRVAKLIYFEYLKKPPIITPPASGHSAEEKERRSNCLARCLKHISPDSYKLLLSYYEEEGATRISHRKQRAEEMGIDLKTLRVRISRIKSPLAKCVHACMKELEES